MIVIQTETFQLDISTFGVTLKEENDLFTNSINRNYSLPFYLDGTPDILRKLGIPTLKNISNLDTKISCRIIMPTRHYSAILFLGEVTGSKIECDLVYGDETLPVYDRELKDLPWPINITTSAAMLAKGNSKKAWPLVAFNFPMLYRPKIKEDSNYEAFEGFVNNYQGFDYVENEEVNGEFLNRNVLAPFPYVLEILRFIYETAGKRVMGKVFENELLKKVLYVPENYLEKFRGAEYVQFSFYTPVDTEFSYYGPLGIYEREFTPTLPGDYEIDYNLNLDPVLARYFEFNIFSEDALSGARTPLFEASSQNNRVSLDDNYSVNIPEADQYDKIVVQLKLNHTTEDISEWNNFEYSFKGGQLNQYPNVFSLKDFVPDMTAGEFVNEIANWLNLDIDINERFVNINFAQESVLQKNVRKHDHLEIPEPTITNNTNRFYKLSYANGERVFVNKNGRIYSDQDEEGDDVVNIDMDVQPLVVERNKDITTAVWPEEKAKINLVVYDGYDQNNLPTCSAKLTRQISLDNIFKTWWSSWIDLRIHSKTFKESFECSAHQIIDIKELSYKYNEQHIIKELTIKSVNEKVVKVDLESETF